MLQPAAGLLVVLHGSTHRRFANHKQVPMSTDTLTLVDVEYLQVKGY